MSDAAWQEIDVVVAELARLSQSGAAAEDFYAALLSQATHVLAARGAALWTRSGTGLRLERWAVVDQKSLVAVEHRRIVESALSGSDSRLIAPTTGGSTNGHGEVAESLLLLAPFDYHAGRGLVEVLQRPDTSPAAQRGFLNFVETLAEIAADFERRGSLRQLEDQQSIWQQWDTLVGKIHGSLELGPASYAIANEGRRLISADRLTVLADRRGVLRVSAVSGADVFDKRSSVVRSAEQLAKSVAAAGEAIWYRGDLQVFPPQLQTPLQQFLDHGHARLLGVMPLYAPQPAPQSTAEPAEPARLVGALIAEKFDSHVEPQLIESRSAVLATHAARALTNALDYTTLPLLPVSRGLNRLRWLTRARQLPKTILALVAAAVVVALLVFVPAELEIAARGELQPVTRQDVFAASEGAVDQLLVKESDPVKAAQVLITLRRPAFDLEASRVAGEFQTARKRVASVQAARLSAQATDTPEKLQQLTAEEEEARVLLKSLEEQEKILQREREQLSLRSPIDGVVVTWNVEQLLAGRPVERGQALLSVADLAGPWRLELRVPDDQAGHVMAARREQREDLPVTFILATEPSQKYTGRISQVALATDSGEADGPAVRVLAKIDDRQQLALRPGATVLAKIGCGQRSLGYVWLHNVIAAIRARLLF